MAEAFAGLQGFRRIIDDIVIAQFQTLLPICDSFYNDVLRRKLH